MYLIKQLITSEPQSNIFKKEISLRNNWIFKPSFKLLLWFTKMYLIIHYSLVNNIIKDLQKKQISFPTSSFSYPDFSHENNIQKIHE